MATAIRPTSAPTRASIHSAIAKSPSPPWGKDFSAVFPPSLSVTQT